MKVTILYMLFLFSSMFGNAQPLLSDMRYVNNEKIGFKIYLNRLVCMKTTDRFNADEVYILVFGQSSTGEKFFMREPGPSHHWDMNDNPKLGDDKSVGDSYAINDKLLFTGSLALGQTVQLNFLVSEEDDGIDFKKVAEEVKKIDNPITATISTVMDAFGKAGIGSNTDDWMGMFSCTVTNNGNTIVTNWAKKDGVYSFESANDPFVPSKRLFKINHDGSDYNAIVSTQVDDESKKVRIKNVWKQNFLSFGSSGLVCCKAMGVEDIGFEVKRLEDKNDCYLKTALGYVTRKNSDLIFTDSPDVVHSKWFLEEVTLEPSHFRIKYPKENTYINIEQGFVALTTIVDHWLSAKWVLEPIK